MKQRSIIILSKRKRYAKTKKEKKIYRERQRGKERERQRKRKGGRERAKAIEIWESVEVEGLAYIDRRGGGAVFIRSRVRSYDLVS